MRLSTLRSQTDTALVAQALRENAGLQARSFAIVEGTQGEKPWAVVLQTHLDQGGMRLIAQGGVGTEVTVSVPTKGERHDYVGKVTHLQTVGKLRGILENAMAPMLLTTLAASGFINAIPALGGDLGTVAASLLATFGGVYGLSRYFQRLSGSDLAGAVVSGAVESVSDGAELRGVRLAETATKSDAPIALPAPEQAALVIPPVSQAELARLRA